MVDVIDPGGVTHRLPFERGSATASRMLLKELLSTIECDPMKAKDAVIVVGELVANALDHGRPDDGHLEVSFAQRDGLLKVGVRDGGGGGIPQVRTVSIYDERGRGMAMVQALSREWSCTHERGLLVTAVVPLH